MSNTNTKVTNFKAMGYSFTVEEYSLKHLETPVAEESSSEAPISQNTVEESILPINNHVIQTIDIQRSSFGMRI